MIVLTAALITIAALVFTLSIRSKDLPPPEPESPTKHLEERKATIYESLRDLQFEYRVGKLSDADYQATKADLQKELAAVLAEIDKLAPAAQAVAAASGKAPPPKAARTPAATPAAAKKPDSLSCPHCSAVLPAAMKFCGECGKPLPVEVR